MGGWRRGGGEEGRGGGEERRRGGEEGERRDKNKMSTNLI